MTFRMFGELFELITIYEFPYVATHEIIAKQNINPQLHFNLESVGTYFYKSNQRINGVKSFNLVANLLLFKTNNLFKKHINIELSNNKYKNAVEFRIPIIVA